jgi:STE24 endopeptidase
VLGGNTPEGVWDDALFLVAALVAISLPGLPWEAWAQFRIEGAFGFNKSSPGLWVVDKLKGLVLTVLIGFPLLWALLALVGVAGTLWWVWGWALVFVFQLSMIVLYPKVILPWFNKLSPLPPGELRDRLLSLAQRTGFETRSIEVIDGSRRSGHSNAYFTGFGRFRRIVLFDTLIAQLTPGELEAVLAHEVGHYKRGHIPRMLAVAAVTQAVAFAAIGWLAGSDTFARAFGFAGAGAAPAFLLFVMLSGTVTFWLSPLGNLLSRKHEYEADAFARDAVGGPEPLVGALRRLARSNLSNLTPDPWYSGFHHSHPTLAEREAALLTSPAGGRPGA